LEETMDLSRDRLILELVTSFYILLSNGFILSMHEQAASQ
jgi:hypothetical protein